LLLPFVDFRKPPFNSSQGILVQRRVWTIGSRRLDEKARTVSIKSVKRLAEIPTSEPKKSLSVHVWPYGRLRRHR
jgi:hypothetical protein